MKRAMSLRNQRNAPNKAPKTLKIELVRLPPFEKEYDSIWDQLKIIVSDLVSNRHRVVRPKEINDVLFVLSQDPDKLTFFDNDYGSEKVELAIKTATKLLHVNGTIDLMLSKYLFWKRNELVNGLKLSYLNTGIIRHNWTTINSIASSLFYDSVFHIQRVGQNSLEVTVQSMEFILLMATDPNRIREKIVVLDIGQSKVEVGIAICTHILERMSKERLPPAIAAFQQKRNAKLKVYWEQYLKNITPNHKKTFNDIRCVVEKYWKNETRHQIESFTILLILEPKMLHAKYLFLKDTSDITEETMSDIENQLKCCFHPSVDEKFETKIDTSVDKITQISMPIMVRLKFHIKDGHEMINTHLRRKLADEHDSELRILYGLQAKIIVCANLKTFEWLTIAFSEISFHPSIETTTHLLPDDFKRVSMLSSVRLNESFGLYMKEIKDSYPYLRTELWKFFRTGRDNYMLCMDIDVYSIARLELHKRRIVVGDKYVLKFGIKYD